ncbi:MAG: hypothetical protein WC757_03370 [Candidatus Paceibacterota bacterium]|jgi:glucose-6-phosphate isomerase
MKFDYTHALGITGQQIEIYSKTLSPYMHTLATASGAENYSSPETSLALLHDAKMLKEISSITSTLKTKVLKYVFVIGVGGSSLGARAVYEAVRSSFHQTFVGNEIFPQAVFVDTLDIHVLERAILILQNSVRSPEEVAFCLMSKSGATLETLADFSIIETIARRRWGDSIHSRIVVVTTKQSVLWEECQKNNYRVVAMPEAVSGRFSVFSAAGLLPLSLAGINIDALLEGARKGRDFSLSASKNPALISASILFEYYRQGIRIHDSFFFRVELETLGKWYRQLVSESLGKTRDVNNHLIRSGITPTVSIGPADLHSVAQLLIGGPRDKAVTFIGVQSFTTDYEIHSRDLGVGIVGPLAGTKVSKVVEALYEGTKKACEEGDIPFMEIQLTDVSEYSIGEYMQHKMVEVMLLGQLMHINTFDQPSVESYKEAARKLLRE